jgi:hypothetical protein
VKALASRVPRSRIFDSVGGLTRTQRLHSLQRTMQTLPHPQLQRSMRIAASSDP